MERKKRVNNKIEKLKGCVSLRRFSTQCQQITSRDVRKLDLSLQFFFFYLYLINESKVNSQCVFFLSSLFEEKYESIRMSKLHTIEYKEKLSHFDSSTS